MSGNPKAGTIGSATLDIINPPRDTELAKTAAVVFTYTFPGQNLTPSETWASGFRTAWPSRPMVACGKWSMARAVATS